MQQYIWGLFQAISGVGRIAVLMKLSLTYSDLRPLEGVLGVHWDLWKVISSKYEDPLEPPWIFSKQLLSEYLEISFQKTYWPIRTPHISWKVFPKNILGPIEYSGF